jgi:hypothetical protein
LPAQPEQDRTLAVCTTTNFAPPISTLYDFRHGVVAETLKYELSMAPTATVLLFAAVDPAMTSATIIPFDGTLAAGTMRTIEHVQHQYWADDLSASLPLGTVETRAHLRPFCLRFAGDTRVERFWRQARTR